MSPPTQIPIDAIRVGARLRKADRDRVNIIAESITEIGLQTPISVVKGERLEDGEKVGCYDLVTGLHRLDACRQLHQLDIAAFILEMGEINRQLWEVDENLARAELTPVVRARFLARRKELYETKFPKTRQGVAGAEGKHRGATANLSFAADTASKIGESERTIQREIRRAKKIAPDILEKIEGTANDNGVVLDQLARLDPAKQHEAAERLAEGKGLLPPKPKTVRTRAESELKMVKELSRLWDKAPRGARRQFLTQIKLEARQLLGDLP